MNVNSERAIRLESATRSRDDARALVLILNRAQEILAEPRSWTRVALARSVLRDAVLPVSERALSWSTSGALALALHDVLGPLASYGDRYRLYDLSVQIIWRSLPDDHPRTARASLDIDGFNDYPGTQHRDVIGVFERAVLAARAAH